jgi:hypothetical protein
VKNSESTESHLLMNKVNAKFNMLCTTVLHRVSREVHHTDVVAVDDSSTVNREPKLLKKTAKPACFGNSSSNNTIFSLCTGPRNRRLAARLPRHQIVAQEHTVARHRPVSIWACCPIGIRVGNERIRGGGVDSKTMIKSAFEIAEDALYKVEMRLTGIVQMETDLLDDIRNFRSGVGYVLESTG